MQLINYPIRLWKYFFAFAAMIRSVTTSSKVIMNYRTLFEVVKKNILFIHLNSHYLHGINEYGIGSLMNSNMKI